jgi:hypothetical protein
MAAVGENLYFGNNFNCFSVWNGTNGDLIHTVPGIPVMISLCTGLSVIIYTVAVSQEILACGHKDSRIIVWILSSGEVLKVLQGKSFHS